MTTNPRDADEVAVLLHTIKEFHDWIRTNVLFPVVPDTERDALVVSLKRVEHVLVDVLYDLDALDKVKRMPANVTALKRR